MKPLFVILFLLEISASMAQSKFKRTVTFRLDPDTEFTRVHSLATIGIRGNIPPLSWDSTYVMKYNDKEGIFETTVTFLLDKPSQVLEFKYFHDISSWESTGNRKLTLTKPLIVLPVKTWNSGPAVKPTPDIITESDEQLRRIIHKLDSTMFSTFYTCNPVVNAKFFMEDLEFYHDKGGLTKGKKSFMEGLARNYCGKQKYRTRRELIDSTFYVCHVPNYGAIETGSHLFYESENGAPGKLVGIAKFLILWKKEKQQWKVSRVMSYDHAPMN